ncbi:citrate lyase subunit beta/citryl-CoA lyase [Psychromicrobium silvestre]|uniref:Citrate lyase subunit beta/citryl-CoA lyase n=1 Tax=Psychromicrobium silvestre TaxID=1645614 RepID=A0A7Y9S9X3_9MICC|nr:CoA ester lyase [Psychromicrobium silvestre]NYE96682.1 citrate lyase subunit beta/citryl-CoA lyase [Psychromicrobium silvestre]
MTVIYPPFEMGPSLLFCPADRPERYAKAAERADAVILDLEDAVAPEAKAAARQALQENLLDPERTIVRVNPLGTPEFALDTEALRATPYRTVMVAKAESGQAIVAALTDYSVLALCETALGVVRAAEIAQARNVVGLMWGAEDLVASLGGSSSRTDDGGYRAVALQARSQVLLAAGAFGKAAIDAVYLNIPDIDGLYQEAQDAVACGFSATACIHPSQVEHLRRAYLPPRADIEYAQALLMAADEAENGVFSFQGRMIDGPVLKQAEQTLRRASS